MSGAADLFRLLGDPTRLRLLRALARDRFNVTELTGILGLAQSGVSRHLGLLKDAGLVSEAREAGYVYYRLNRASGDPRLPETNGHAALWPLRRIPVLVDDGRTGNPEDPFAGLVHGPGKAGRLAYSGLILVSAVTGAAIAGRQVWLQHLPPEEVPACGPGLDFMLEVFPLADALKMVFTGSGECAEVDWTFLGFSIAEWSLAWFIAFAAAALAHMVQSMKQRKLFAGL